MAKEWDPNPAYEAAFARHGAGEHQAALDLMMAALAAQPDRPRIHSNQAMVLMALDRLDEARAAAERGRDLADLSDSYPLMMLARVMDRAGDHEAALALLDQTLVGSGYKPADRVDLLVTRAWVLLHLERDREAITGAREALELAPDRVDVHLILARSLALANRWEEGLRSVERALALAPEDAEALELKSTIDRGMAITANSVATARAECANKPEDWERWLTLGTCLTMSGALAEAAAAFDRAHELNPDENDRWPDEPYMLSPWEVDCRLALLHEPGAPSPAAAPHSRTKKPAPPAAATKSKKSQPTRTRKSSRTRTGSHAKKAPRKRAQPTRR